jgi:hypothetical protein
MLKSILFVILLLILNLNSVISQNYNADNIPDSLKQNATCVIVESSRILELSSSNTSVEKIRNVYTILNKDGLIRASLAIPYDKYSKVVINSITLFDAKGEVIKKAKINEIADVPAFNNYTFYTDDRLKLFRPDFAEFPFTVAYDYEISSTNNLSYNCWNPMGTYNTSVISADFKIIYPGTVLLHNKEINIQSATVEINRRKKIKYWSLKNIKAIENEPLSLNFKERSPAVYIMPSELIYNQYKGSSDNWKLFGSWIFGLFKDRDELNDVVKLKINSILHAQPDTLERIKAIYEFMQQNTRYVAIKLGIGGYQPVDAKSVCNTGYGECKALSNFMYALLKYAGIKSYPALVSSGTYIEPVFKDFPNFNQFDHVILCVPFHNDTIWLECTSQKMPFGFIGDFTDDRDVLLITEDGGCFAHTKKYSSNDNLKINQGKISIDTNGNASCDLKITYSGLHYNYIFELVCAGPEDQEKWLLANSTLPSLQIIDFNVTHIKNILPQAILNESLISRNYATFSGNYMILPLNKINFLDPITKMVKARKSDFIIHRSFCEYDTVVFKVPPNFIVESVQPSQELISPFGSYKYSVTVVGNEISYKRSFSLNQGRYNSNEYNKFYEFMLSISNADNLKVVLKNK